MSTRVLLCDDSGVILTLLEKRLKDIGYEVVGKAKDGNECITKYKMLKPDLLLLDITMPNKDGRECLEELMLLDPKAKIVMVSAVLDEEVQRSCLEAGAKAFINKGNISSIDDFKNKVLPIIQPIILAA
ncbi:MAG: response regulator [Bdellovibrionota bacterium]